MCIRDRWNPMVVLFPLLLLVLLSAAALDRSTASLVGALVVGSYVVQTDISTAPLAVALVGAAVLFRVVTAVLDRGAGQGAHAVRPTAGTTGSGPARGVLVVGGLVVALAMWVPPLVQQATDHPGNLTLIARFFGASHPGPPVAAAVRSVVSGAGVLVAGPTEVMTSIRGGTPAHAGLSWAVALGTVVLAAVVAVAAARQRSRFGVGIGALTLLGCAVAVVAVGHVVGFVFGYLVIWVVVLPVAALIGAGTVRLPLGRWAPGLRVALCATAVVVGTVACVRVADIPPLATVPTT